MGSKLDSKNAKAEGLKAAAALSEYQNKQRAVGMGAAASAELADMMGNQIVEHGDAVGLSGGQQRKLQTMLQERAQMLHKFFDEQLKKQYEAMKREVSKLAKQHQRDVQSLDERFKAKMIGLTNRFKALEAEEARNEQLRQDNVEFQAEVARLDEIRLAQEERHERTLEELSLKQREIDDLGETIKEAAARENGLHAEVKLGKDRLKEAQVEAQKERAEFNKQLKDRQGEIEALTAKLLSAKNFYDDEMRRKMEEIRKLGQTVSDVNAANIKMKGFVGQVQEQIKKREADMRTQLALMKNTIAFALYIDETLAVDLTDPHAMAMMQRPVVCVPSGISYSTATIEKIMADAQRDRTEPLCPQTGMVIERVVPNQAVESILARYFFKQQITKDVISALREFQQACGMGEEDQPLEAYLKRMKENMVERLQETHQQEMSRTAATYEEKVKRTQLESDKHEGASSELQQMLESTKEEMMRYQQQATDESTRMQNLLDATQERLQETVAERDEHRAHAEQSLARVQELQGKLAKYEEEVKEDIAVLDESTDNAELRKLRRQDVLELKARLADTEAKLDQMQGAAEGEAEKLKQLQEQERELKSELAGQKKLEDTLQKELKEMKASLNKTARQLAVTKENLRATEAARDEASTQGHELTVELSELQTALRQREVKLEQVGADAAKLRARSEEKSQKVREQGLALAQLGMSHEELHAESARKERALSEARTEVAYLKQQFGEAEQQRVWYVEETTRQQALVKKRDESLSHCQDELAKMHAEVQRLNKRLDEVGAAEAQEVFKMSSMEDAKERAGVNLPLNQLPRVPVLQDMLDTLGENLDRLTDMSSNQLQAMAQVKRGSDVEAFNADSAFKGRAAASEAAGESDSGVNGSASRLPADVA